MIFRSCSLTKRRLSLNSSRKNPSISRSTLNPSSVLPALPSGARILLLRLRSIGDIVLLTPALRLLKTWRPDLQISVFVESRFRELLAGNPCVNEVLHPCDATGWQALVAPVRAARELRGRKFALCINLHGGPRSAFLARWCGATWKAGFEHFRNGGIYDFSIPDARNILGQPVIHTAEHQAAALFWLGLPQQSIPPSEIFVSDSGKAEWTERRSALGIPLEREYAIIQPTALYPTKEWAAEGFARLGGHIEESTGILPVFSCGPGESERLDAVEQASSKKIRRLENPSLAAFMAALSSARLFVGNDSGPAHIAAALRRPLVVIFGSSNSRIWRPWAGSPPAATGRAFRMVQNSYECNPCRGDRCYRFDRPQCILSVTLAQVQAAVDSVLNEEPGTALVTG